MKNISDLMKPVFETLAEEEINGLSALEIHNAFIEASIAKEKIKKKQKVIENKMIVSYLLPSCSDKVLAVPNAVLRGSLFGVVGKGRRKHEDNVLKTTINGISVRYTGKQLDQADLDVWAECFRLNQGLRLGEEMFFSSKAFLLGIGRNNGKTDRDWLYSCFRRLMGAVVEIGDGNCFYTGQLLQHWCRDEKTGKNSLVLNQKLLPFFQTHFWTGLMLEQRLLLKNKSLAKWLHGFYSTHQKPFEYKVEKLMALCGSDVLVVKTFKQKLKKALIELSSVTGWECLIDTNHLVHVKKK